MMKAASVILCVAFSLLFQACGESTATEGKEGSKLEQPIVHEENSRPANNKVCVKRHFSSQEKMDEFILHLRGKNHKEAKLTFCILNSNRDTLFIRSAKGSVLLERDQEKKRNAQQEIELIHQHMSTFFSSTGFSNPPYTLNDPTKAEFPGDLSVWEEIKNDSSAWSFEFSLLEGGKSEVIAYSKTKDSIFVYDHTP